MKRFTLYFAIVCILGLLQVGTLDAQSQQPQLAPAASSAPAPAASVPTTTTSTPAVLPTPILEPKWSKFPYLLMGDKLAPLEQQDVGKRHGGFKEKGYIYFEGTSAKVRVPSSAVFVVKFGDEQPGAIIRKMSVDDKKHERNYISTKQTVTGSETQNGNRVDTSLQEYGPFTKVVPANALERGEYVLWVVSVAYPFGVD
jgi:hypothetical protein